MATLADSFLADFESDDEEDNEQKEEKEEENQGEAEEMPEPEVKEIDLDLEEDEQKTEDLVPDATQITNILTDPVLENHLKIIEKFMASAPQEDDREKEYDHIVKSNEMIYMINNEMLNVHKLARDIYAVKYQELEQLVQNPIDYAKVVKIIGNETDMSLKASELTEIVPQHTILTITVTATTTIGKPLPEEDLNKALEACNTILKLDECRTKIFAYIEGRMAFIAPNTCALVGSEIAARMMGIAGGLKQLSLIPSCNLQVLGANRKHLSGFSAAKQDFHMGLLAASDLVLGCPPDLRMKAVRQVAAKLALVTRIDAHNQDPTGDQGRTFREEVEKKIMKWQEPPPPKKNKALPVPNDTPRRKRGGKRYRKQRDKFKVTELHKQKNRMVFGKEEVVDEYTGEGQGMLGQSGTGKLKIKQDNAHKLAKHLSRKTQARLRRVKGSATANVPGMASTIAFTPVQGMELVAPDAAKARQAAKDQGKYFSTTQSFARVKRQRVEGATPLPGVSSEKPAIMAPPAAKSAR